MDAFCRCVYARLIRALFVAYGDRDLAQDLAQEALSRIVERWEYVQSLDDPEGYAFQTGFNLGRSRWRHGVAERRACSRAGLGVEPGVHEDDDVVAVLVLRQALATLSPRQRVVIVHRYYLERSVAETAALMGCAEGTVKALTSQAIGALRAREVGAAPQAVMTSTAPRMRGARARRTSL